MSEARNANADARAAILASISRSLAASRPFDTEHQKHHRPSAPPVTPTVPVLRLETLIENFRSSLTFVGADCRVVHGRQEAAAEVRAVIESHSAKQIAVSDSSMVAELMPDIKAAPSVLFGCDLGITSAQWGIAETGTLVLESERESHRLTSLVPPVHLCILKATDIRQTLGEILELISKNLSRTVTFITGASRTSDIELTLAIGVHGPKELHILVIND
jgi:L-lactate utilization protein LutC